VADCDGRPYAIPLPFCWLDQILYLRLPLTGRKGAVLACNDQVYFEVDTLSDDLQAAQTRTVNRDEAKSG
jgi:nitroimidazol reductase NimA-like FMN-containing flavoprotein (pyridoxamine 5'-phosphate oxidase superfamily)